MSDTKPRQGRCGARLRKKPGQFCALAPLRDSNRCRIHGGASLRGPASGQFKTGRFSKYLGGALGDAYENSVSNPELLDLKDGIAVLDAIARRAAARVAERDTPRFRERAIELHEKMDEVLEGSDPDIEALRKHAADLGRLLNAGDHEDRAMRFLSDSIEKFSKRAEEATKLALAKHAAIPAADLVILFARLAEAVTRTAPRDVAAKVLREMDGLIAPLSGAGPTTVGDKRNDKAQGGKPGTG